MATNLYMANAYIKTIEGFKSYMSKLNPANKILEVDKVQDKILDTIGKLKFQLKDIKLTTGYRHWYSSHETIWNTITNSVPNCTTIEQLINLKDLLGVINTNEVDDLRIYDLTHEADRYYYDYIESITIAETVLQDIRFHMNPSSLNMFFVDCKNGENISAMRFSHDKVYANTTSYITDTKRKADRVIKGGLKGSFISNNFFDVVVVTPCMGYKLNSDPFGRVAEPDEKLVIRNCIKYVRTGGVYIMMLPATRVDDSLALWLSKMLSENTQVIKNTLEGDGLEKVIIIGQKDVTQKAKDSVYRRLKRMDYSSLPGELDQNFDIPTEELTLEYFRGSILDESDIIEAMNPNIINNFLNNQTQPLVVKDQSPLLPFNIGQVGLVLTSGCLDGVVEEVDGVYHVIKGMTTKLSETKTEVSEDNSQVKSTETISNQVKINVFTADGKFISLG